MMQKNNHIWKTSADLVAKRQSVIKNKCGFSCKETMICKETTVDLVEKKQPCTKIP